MATPTLRCLRLNFPHARIDLTLVPYVREIVEGAPWFDAIIEYEAGSGFGGLAKSAGYLRRLRRNRYDLAIVLPNSFRSALLAFLSGAKRRVGYDRQGRGLLLTDAAPAPVENGRVVPQPMVEYYLNLCDGLVESLGSRKTELFVDSRSEQRADELFDRYGIGRSKPVVAINPGAAYGSSKLWIPDRFAAVADHFAGDGRCDVVLLGAPAEGPIARAIVGAARTDIANLAEEHVGLGLLKSIIKRCDLLITVDSGPRHFAVAFNKPVVVLMGPTDPRYTNCNLDKTTVLRIEDLDCVPCHMKQCPAHHECMTRITADMVIQAATELLQRHVKAN